MRTNILLSTAILAGVTFASQASALDLSDRNDGLAHPVMCSNVPAHSGSVPGFLIPNIGWFVAEEAADRATVDAFVVPAAYDVKVGEEVMAYFASVGLENYRLVLDRDDSEIIEEQLPRDVATGPVPSGDNLTSMGDAVSDGQTILRVRSTISQDVELRKAGGGTETVSVDPGDTFVAVDGPGTYIATFQGTHVRKTKATGPQAFNDLVEVEVSVSRPAHRIKWCR